MNIAQRWSNYCDHAVAYATEDDWNNFVQSVYAQWRASQIERLFGHPLDQQNGSDQSGTQHLNFETFVQNAPEYQELCAIEKSREILFS
jgi:hypothetical protein